MNTSDTSQVFKVGKWMRWAQLLFFAYMGPRFMDYLLSRSEMQQFLKADEKFDLIVGETVFVESAVAGFSYKYNAPIVLIAPFLPNNWANHMVRIQVGITRILSPIINFQAYSPSLPESSYIVKQAAFSFKIFISFRLAIPLRLLTSLIRF